MKPRGPRGPYAKGAAKREEIIEKAIESFGRTGYHATSMREIAAECNLSQAGLLHHFPDKESLLLAIVERREATSVSDKAESKGEVLSRYLKQVDANQEQEAITRLWANLVGEATDPDHPAHEHFKNRYQILRAEFAQEMAELNSRSKPNQEDGLKAALFIALWDGLQNQWLIDESFDMKPAFKYAIEMFSEYSKSNKSKE